MSNYLRSLALFCRNTLRCFVANSGGGVALTFGLAVIPVAGIAAASLDYSRASQVRSLVASAADAAAIAALRAGKNNDQEVVGRRVFESYIAKDVNAGRLSISGLKVKVTKNGTLATVDCDAKLNTVMMKVMGTQSQLVSCHAVAEIGGTANTDLVVLIDNSASMTRPLDPNVSPPVDASGCSFACHMSAAAARTSGIRTRMDAGMEVLRRLIPQIDRGGNITYTIYTVSDRLRHELGPTGTRSQFMSRLDNINFVKSSHLGDEMRNFEPIVRTLGQSINRALVILTDGVEEFRNDDYISPGDPALAADPLGDPVWLGAPDGTGRPVPALAFPQGRLPGPTGFLQACEKIKSYGFKIYVVYVPHPATPFLWEPSHQENEPASRNALAKCSSAEGLAVLNRDDEVDGAVKLIMNGIKTGPRLTQ